MFRKMLFVSMVLIFAACGTDPADSTTLESFIFKPVAGITDGSNTIAHVYLCGTFNNWNEYNAEMVWNATNNRYEYGLRLESGSYQYKFKVVYTSGNVNWFADPRAVDACPDGGYGLNSIRVVPSSIPNLYTVSCVFSNAQQFIIAMGQGNESSNWEDFDNTQPSADVYSWQMAVSAETSHQYSLDVVGVDDPQTLSINRFHYMRWVLPVLDQDMVIPTPAYAYTNTLLLPSGGTYSKDDIDFSWPLPAGVGTVTNIKMFFTSFFGESLWIEGISPVATNYHFSGDAAITGGGKTYLWGVRFTSDSGWIYTSRFVSIVLN